MQTFHRGFLAAEDRGVEIRYVDINPEDCTLKLDEYAKVLNDRTRLVAVGCASNAVGTINPVQKICQWARECGALSFLDAVHYAPHALMDVEAWGCDFLMCSAYKFFGPHIGIQYGRRELLESLQPYKLRPSPNNLPGRWMTGTQNHECIWGTHAAIDYMASIGGDMASGMAKTRCVADGVQEHQGLRRTTTAAITRRPATDRRDQSLGHHGPNTSARTLPHHLDHPRTISHHVSWRSDWRSMAFLSGMEITMPCRLTERLGVEPEGMVRIGLVHYNTASEVDRLLDHLGSL